MRIALVSQEYPPETGHGGIAAQTQMKARGLAALGHDVVVVSHSTDDERHEYAQDGATVIRIPGADADLPILENSVRWLTYSTKVAMELARLKERAPFDVVDFPEWGSEGYVHLLNRAGSDDTPAVVHIHGPLGMLAETISWPDKDSRLYEVGMYMEGVCLRSADAVISSSACSRDWCAKLHGIDAAEVEVLHLGVDLESFRPVDGERSGRRVLFVGRLAPSKGVGHLVDAMRQLSENHPGLELLLAGRGDPGYVDELRARLAGTDVNVEVMGHVDRSELPALLARSDILAAPSLYEGGPGLVYIEAMACGVPVVATAAGGASEVVREGENGFLVEPTDVSAIARALNALVSDPSLARRLGEGGRAFVEAHADTRSCAARLEEIYREAAA